MNNKFKILTIISIALIFCTKVFAAADNTVTKMKIDNSTTWTNISISESYAECEALNSPDSTLGTSALEAHLTTAYDWSIMAIFSVSQYGAATTDATVPTTGTTNKSGIYDIGASHPTQTTAVLNNFTATTGDFAGLYKDGKLKKYINKIHPTTGKEYDENNNEIGRVALAYAPSTSGGTVGWLGAVNYRETDTRYPIGIMRGLFHVTIGADTYAGNDRLASSGERHSVVTFRPVIWN